MTDAAADALWAPLVEHGSTWCAPNVHAACAWITVSGRRWRVAVTQPRPRNSYVVSATGQYLDYAKEEIRRLPSPVHRSLARIALAPLAPMLRALDPVVILDALPVSTVLHTSNARATWDAALDAVSEAFPGLPVMIRSLDAIACPTLLADATALRLRLMPSRLVFHQDPRAASFWRIRNVRNDLAMMQGAPLPVRPLMLEDVPEITRLYWLLYGEKHSLLNPCFTEAWLAHGMATGVLHGSGVIHEGRLAAAYLSYQVEDIMTNPVFGYDTALPQQLGLYRRLSVLTMQDARSRDVRLHASSGAPGFKASRGGVSALEFHGVQLRGVTGAQRAAWESALRLASTVGPSLLRRAT
jgi:hypothetical protein